MGYYTVVEVSLKIKPEKIEEFKKKIQEMKERLGKDKSVDWFSYYDDIEIDDDGNVDFDESYRKWHEEEKFYDFIKDFVGEGSITGQGDEFLDVWRVVFDGKGGWKMQGIEFVDEIEVS